MAMKIRCRRKAPVVVNTPGGAIVFRPGVVVKLDVVPEEVKRAVASRLLEFVSERPKEKPKPRREGKSERGEK